MAKTIRGVEIDNGNGHYRLLVEVRVETVDAAEAHRETMASLEVIDLDDDQHGAWMELERQDLVELIDILQQSLKKLDEVGG